MSTQSLDSDIYDYGFILNSTALHEAAMSVLVTTIYGRWRGITTIPYSQCESLRLHLVGRCQYDVKYIPQLYFAQGFNLIYHVISLSVNQRPVKTKPGICNLMAVRYVSKMS